MPHTMLSPQEKDAAIAFANRRWRYTRIFEEHAEVVRDHGRTAFNQAYNEASADLKPKEPTGQEIMYPLPGTNMEEHYAKFEYIFSSEPQTLRDHMFISLVAGGLTGVAVTCEYAYLSEAAQREAAVTFTRLMAEYFASRSDLRPASGSANTQTATRPNSSSLFSSTQRLPLLPGLTGDQKAKLRNIETNQVGVFLSNPMTLHHNLFWDNECEMTYKIVSVNYSLTGPGIESFEAQLEGCCSSVTILYEELKEMLARSSEVI